MGMSGMGMHQPQNGHHAAATVGSPTRTECGVMLMQPLELRGERKHLVRSMITGRVRLLDSEVILEDTMVTGAVSLEGNSRLVLIRGMITGSVTHTPTSSFENNSGGMVTGYVRIVS